ncbi:MAG: YceI family protein [Chloroflexota bacterium]|nr:MAG: hypothetical protein DIU68_02105 [Chloroflexota bacterium]
MPTWKLDPAHSRANFSVRHMMVSTVRGGFDRVSGKLEFDPEHPEKSYVEAVIDAASISTGVEDRDNHLRSADFLDVENYPTITFKSTDVTITGENTADVHGNLTIRGVTKPVTLKVEHVGTAVGMTGARVSGFEARTQINREDFGLTWNVALETGGVLVGKEVRIDLDVEAIEETEGAAATAG